MRRPATFALVLVATLAAGGCASFTLEAHGGGSTVPGPPPGRGHDDDRDHDRDHDHDHDHAAPARLHIPPGHFPPPGACRVWHPGSPPGHQPAPGSCSVVERDVGPGDWLIYRPTSDKRVVRVSFYDRYSPGVRVAVRVYDRQTGEYLRDR